MSLLTDVAKRSENPGHHSPHSASMRTLAELALEPETGAHLDRPEPSPMRPAIAAGAGSEPRLAAPDTNAQFAGPRSSTASAAASPRTPLRAAFAIQPSAMPRRRLMAIFGVSAAAAMAIGVYFQNQVSELFAPPPRAASYAPTAAARSSSPALPTLPVVAASTASAAPLVPAAPPAASETAALPAIAAKTPAPPAVPTTPPQPVRSPAKPAASASRAANEAQPTSAISVITTTPRTDPSLLDAYNALEKGDLDAARRAYERALAGDSLNADALLGLAAVSLRQGQAAQAEALYERVLEADPRNAAAIVGLIGLHLQADPARSESRLKTLLAQPADIAVTGVVRFTLGNLYAGQRRWHEAQRAYFDAYASEPGNPDYHYNLALSLDHLQQAQLAAQFYQSALALVETRTAGFDRNEARQRLAEIQRSGRGSAAEARAEATADAGR